MGKIFCCGIATLPFEIPHKVSYLYTRKIFTLFRNKILSAVGLKEPVSVFETVPITSTLQNDSNLPH